MDNEMNQELQNPVLSSPEKIQELMCDKKLYVLDMDGTIYLGPNLFPETKPFLQRVKENGKKYIFFTNNSSRSPETYVQRLNSMGIPATRSDIVTSGDVMIHFLKTHRSGKTIYLVGTPDLRKSLEEAGLPLVNRRMEEFVEDRTSKGLKNSPQIYLETCGCPDIVLLGFDTTLTYEKLEYACHFLRSGSEFLCTHEDVNCPTEYGFMPDTGAMCALITRSTGGIMPRFTGKPHVEVLEILETHTGINRNEMVAVGDRLYTDIALGASNGVASVLVLSGETTLEDLEESTVKPTLVVPSIASLEQS